MSEIELKQKICREREKKIREKKWPKNDNKVNIYSNASNKLGLGMHVSDVN